MLFIIPVSRSDIKIAPFLVEGMAFFGGLANHSVMFAPAPSVHHEMGEMAAMLRGVCPRVSIDPIPREPSGGWPLACNIHFRDVVEMITAKGIEEPWMFLEADSAFTRPGGPDRLQLEYHKRGMPFMGVIRDTKETMKNADGSPFDGGKYMVGVGIYPPNFKEHSCLYRSVGQISKDPKAPKPIGFDQRIRHEVAPKAWNTDLMEHRRSTGNYRYENGRIVCDDFERMDGNQSYAGTIGEMAFFVHGCKDGSLSKLVMNSSQSAPAPIVVNTQTSEAPTVLEAFKTLCDRLSIPKEEQSQRWEQLVSPLPAPEQTEDQSAGDPEQEAELDAVLDKPKPLGSKLREYVENCDGPIELATLAADFKTSQQILKGVIELPDSGLKLNKRMVELTDQPVPA